MFSILYGILPHSRKKKQKKKHWYALGLQRHNLHPQCETPMPSDVRFYASALITVQRTVPKISREAGSVQSCNGATSFCFNFDLAQRSSLVSV